MLTGLIIGAFGTLIGAGGGFLLVPFLLLFYPGLEPEIVTAISIAIVSLNAISGTVAYARSGRVDYRAGITFALYTIPSSVLGVMTAKYIPSKFFGVLFGSLLVILSFYLFIKNRKETAYARTAEPADKKGLKHHTLTDKTGLTFSYSYNPTHGKIISIIVGYISPLLGIGGGIIHVPAMANWLKFPVYVATATSHFVLAIMATVSVIVHIINHDYSDPAVLHMILFLGIGVVPGAQLGAMFSHKLKGNIIIKVLAFCLILVGVRVLMNNF